MSNKRLFELTENTSPTGIEYLMVDSSTYSEAKSMDIDTLKTYMAGTYADPDAIHDDTAAEIYLITEKTAPDNLDILLIEDSEDSFNKKKLQLANLDLSQCDNSSSGFITSSALALSTLTEKTYLVDDDVFVIEDSEDSYAKKSVKATHIPEVSTGDGAPTSTPNKVGNFYVDTTGATLYFSKGTSSSSDWVAL